MNFLIPVLISLAAGSQLSAEQNAFRIGNMLNVMGRLIDDSFLAFDDLENSIVGDSVGFMTKPSLLRLLKQILRNLGSPREARLSLFDFSREDSEMSDKDKFVKMLLLADKFMAGLNILTGLPPLSPPELERLRTSWDLILSDWTVLRREILEFQIEVMLGDSLSGFQRDMLVLLRTVQYSATQMSRQITLTEEVGTQHKLLSQSNRVGIAACRSALKKFDDQIAAAAKHIRTENWSGNAVACHVHTVMQDLPKILKSYIATLTQDHSSVFLAKVMLERSLERWANRVDEVGQFIAENGNDCA